LEEQKDPLALVDAVSSLDRDDVALVFVGDGTLRPEVERRARERLRGRLTITGVVDDPRALIAGADVFALPSRWEGLPRAVVEALDAGLPVVASDVGGVSEVIADGRTGLLVAPEDTSALAAAIVRLLDDSTFARTVATAGPAAVSDFSEQAMARDHMTLYNALLSR
jgi:glycosyltransferase involved in cell wall biosynthesis